MQHLVGYSALLDPRMHTYEWVAERSVFLMAVIIQAAARRDSNPTFEARSAMIASTLGRHIREVIWPRVVVGNYRSTQVCQAMMIWGAYSNAADIGDEDPSWLLFGHACEWRGRRKGGGLPVKLAQLLSGSRLSGRRTRLNVYSTHSASGSEHRPAAQRQFGGVWGVASQLGRPGWSALLAYLLPRRPKVNGCMGDETATPRYVQC